jgi:hypothetical protein
MRYRHHQFEDSLLLKLLCMLMPLLFSTLSMAGQTPAFTSFDAPDAGTGADEGTYPAAINGKGMIAGNYIDNANRQHGFIRQANGQFIDFTPPHTIDITVMALNNPGQVVGTASTVLTPPYVFSGFLRNPNGRYAIFAPTGAVYTAPLGINDSGVVTGYYYDSAGNYHGFLRNPGGAITVIDEPDASIGSGKGTWATAINANGAVAGYYTDISTGTFRVFIRDQFGNFTNFDAASGTVYPVTFAINLSSEVAGRYSGSDNVNYGFVRDAFGNVTDFAVPGSVSTTANAMNDSGVIVGYWDDSNGTGFAFRRDAAGNFTTFSAPKPHLFTLATGINNNGRMTGVWRDMNFNDHGFVQ